MNLSRVQNFVRFVCVFAVVASSAPENFCQQPFDKTALQAAAQSAIDTVLDHYGLDSTALVEKTGKPLPADGKWFSSTVAPSCPTAPDSSADPCIRVIYKVPDTAISCEWTVLLTNQNKSGLILDQNDDATKYLLRKLSEAEAKPLRTAPRLTYPEAAKQEHQEGKVLVSIVYTETGSVKSTQLISGPPLLTSAALDAAKHSTSRPFLVGTRPIPYQTIVTSTFTFGLGSVTIIGGHR